MKFLDYVGANYERLLTSFRVGSKSVGIDFDFDVFGDTILKCHDRLQDRDMEEGGICSYFWKAFKNNSISSTSSVEVSIGEEFDVEEDTSPVIDAESIRKKIVSKFGSDMLTAFEEHLAGKTYKELDRPDLKYKFRRIREFVRETTDF